jgi:hypothetical protein
MFENIWTYITTQVNLIDPFTWVLLFFISIVYDIVYTKSILHISKLNAAAAAHLSVILYIMMAYGTINYVKNFINVIPIIVGAWLGTYGILKYEKHQKNKQENKEKI